MNFKLVNIYVFINDKSHFRIEADRKRGNELKTKITKRITLGINSTSLFFFIRIFIYLFIFLTNLLDFTIFDGT